MGLDEENRNRFTARFGAGDDVELPMVPIPGPESRIDPDPQVPEENRECGHCRAPVGRASGEVPGPTEGQCTRCGTPFSFSPKLGKGDLVAGQYEVLGCLTRGGLGWIYLARDRNLDGRYVVLKGLLNTGDAAAARLAVNEGRVLAASEHPNIVRIFNVVTHPDPHSPGQEARYIVMDYVGGHSLREMMVKARSAGGLKVEHVIAYGRAILAALDYLHSQGLLYCDMKPDNVIHGETQVKVIDLGGIREIGVGTSTVVGTKPYRVEQQEIHERGLTVRSDIYTVGKTLEELFAASDAAEAPEIEFGVDSFRRVLERATCPYPMRYASAMEMATQLDGVLEEILSLREGREHNTKPSMFVGTGVLLDAGLGQPLPLQNWLYHTEPVLSPGRPAPDVVALGLPVPVEDPDDPATAFLRTVRAQSPDRLVEKLAAFGKSTVELEFRRCRAHLTRGDTPAAEACLSRAVDLLAWRAPYDWRVPWHQGLVALVRNEVRKARGLFDRVYWNVPGEQAPKLALGFCAEELGSDVEAKRYYSAVWTRDRSEVSAAFGLARLHLAAGERAAAVSILDQVPGSSPHFDAARIAAVRILSSRIANGEAPSRADLQDVLIERLPALYLDSDEARLRLVTAVTETALALRYPGEEKELRTRLETYYRQLARQARNENEHGVLIDLANSIRPMSMT